ncbi:MAG: MBL fold metallo-hydrolase [Thermovirgaceae bacterium]|nr:MBL fold metallo-hydrolase [Thermovirgaceae bacterium]
MGEKRYNDIIHPRSWSEALPREGFRELERLKTGQDWYSVYRLDEGTLIISEDGQFEENVNYLVTGSDRAALIDTGDDLGDIRELVEELTSLPVFVVNTHSHIDHIGGNYLFEEVWAYDHSTSRESAAIGVPHELALETIRPGSLCKPVPQPFCEETYHIPPYRVTHWITNGETIDLGGRTLKAIHTPGHAPDHLMFLEKETGYLWTGDNFYEGCVYTHLPLGDLDVFIDTYRERILPLLGEVRLLLPSHNESCYRPELLREMLELAESARRGEGSYETGGNGIRKYEGSCFSLMVQAGKAKKQA